MYKTLAAVVACFALTSTANAVPVSYSFSGVVSSVYHHPPGELWDGRVLPLGTSVTGKYSFEVNPNNPEQAINGFFEFTAGALHVELPLVNIGVMLYGDANWHEGDRYIASSQNFYPYEFGGYVEEGFGIVLDATAGGILTDHSITPLLDFTEFDVRHEFYYFYRTRYGGVEIRAPLESLVVGVSEPSSIALLLSGSLLIFCMRNTLIRVCPSRDPEARR